MNPESQSRVGWWAVVLASLAIAFLLVQKWWPSSPFPAMESKEPVQIAAESKPLPKLMSAVDSPRREQELAQKRPQQLEKEEQVAELLKKIQALEVREKKRQVEQAAREKAAAEARQKALEEEIARLRHENEEFKARREAQRKARTLVRLKFVYKNSRDDKDPQDVVRMELLNAKGELLAMHDAFGGTKLDNNSESSTEFRVSPVLNEGLAIKLSKSGTDGWIFHFRVVGEFADGSTRELYAWSPEIHFEDQQQSAGPFAIH